ncbi:hypothetical protein [Arthrobacter sp. JSM 101049]|uniref:hypothetical protein n=1 Tax=Arthrobacter sp. JSM 101049 TaxID=929097 RepID=UPI001EB3F4EE|nr:hypothetical protein [Micrococcaceae bacterium RIT 802]
MSSTTRGSYPHPVLDDSDDVDAEIEVFNASFAPSVDDVEIKFQVRMTEPRIQVLIDEGSARYSFRWSCTATLANEELGAEINMYHADSTGYVGWIDQQSISGTVRIEMRVIATKPIGNYRPENQHPDYGDADFHLLPGDILADAGVLEFEAEKLYDPLNPPLGSCFKFVADSNMKRGLRVRFDDDEHILVTFPVEVLHGFGMLRNRQDLQISLVVLPALMETISFIKANETSGDEDENLTDRHWYTAITRLMQASRSSDMRPFEMAQEILGNPLDTSLTTFDDLGD